MKKQTTKPNKDERIKTYQETLKHLETIELPKAMKWIGESGVGDWHENAEYEDAVNQKQLIEVRISELRNLLKNLQN